MKLIELIEIFDKSLLKSNPRLSTQQDKIEKRNERIRRIVETFVDAIRSPSETKQQAFWKLLGHRQNVDFGHDLDIVSEVNHALCFNEGLIEILLKLDLTYCPGFIMAYAAQHLTYYGENHELRKVFLTKLRSYYSSPTLTSLQRLYAYQAILFFPIKSDNTTVFSDLTLTKIYDYLKELLQKSLGKSVKIPDNIDKLLKILSDTSTETSNEIKLIVYVLALTKIKTNTNTEKDREALDQDAVKLLKYNVSKGHNLSKCQLAGLHREGRPGPKENDEAKEANRLFEATKEAIRLYEECNNDETIPEAKVNLALLHHKYLIRGNDATTSSAQKIALCEQAAKQGLIFGIFKLALFYTQTDIQSDGKLSRHHQYAIKLFELLIERGYTKGKDGLDQLNKRIGTATSAASTSTMSSTATILAAAQTSTTATPTNTQTSSSVIKSPKKDALFQRTVSDPATARSTTDFNTSSITSDLPTSSTYTTTSNKRPAPENNVVTIDDISSESSSIHFTPPPSPKRKTTEENYSGKSTPVKR